MSQPPKRTWTKAERALARRRAASKPQAASTVHGSHYANLTTAGRNQTADASTNVSAVTTARLSGGKRKGKSLRKQPRETASTNLTRSDIAAALMIDPAAQAHVTKRGVVKRLDYKR